MAQWREGASVRPFGEAAFVLEWGDAISPAAARRVAAAAAAFDRAAPPGLVEVVPTFRSLLVAFDPDRTDPETLCAGVADAPADARAGATWTVAACLEGAAAEDAAEVAGRLGLTLPAVAERLAAATYTVGMYGFAPGFAYLSGLDAALALPRRPTPRPPMPAGSVIIAAGMAALASVSMPTGWYVVGRTALTMFRAEASPPVPFAVGDRIRFRPVPAAELASLARGGVTPT